MKDLTYKGPDDISDSIVHAKPSTIPYIDKAVIEFIEANISKTFPDIRSTDRDTLLVHQGKLELLAELKLVRESQEVDDE